MALLPALPLVGDLAEIRSAAIVLVPPPSDPAAASSRMPGVQGGIDSGGTRLAARLQALPGLRPEPGGVWRFATQSGSTTMHAAGGRISFETDPAMALPPEVATAAARPLVAGSICEVRRYADRTCRSEMLSAGLAVAEDGLRLRIVGPTPAQVADLGPGGGGAAILDLGGLDLVPRQAVWTAMVALRRGSNANDLAKAVLVGDGPRAAIRQAIEASDGTLVAWVEPGAPMPVVTVCLDMGRAEAAALVAGLGIPVAADGTASAQIGPVQVAIGWRDGWLYATTAPAGLDAVHAGGFATQPEVVRALAALPAQVTACTLVRPAALLDMAMPYLPMIGAQMPMAELKAYRTRLAAGQAYGLLSVAGDAQGRAVIEARGSLVLVGCALLAVRAEDLVRRMLVAN